MKYTKLASALLASGMMMTVGEVNAVAVLDMVTATSTATITANPITPLVGNGTLVSPLVTAVNPTTFTMTTMTGWNGYLVTMSGGAIGVTPVTTTLAPIGNMAGQPLQYKGFVNNTTARSMQLWSGGNLVAATPTSAVAGLQYASFGMWNIRNNAVSAIATPVQFGAWASSASSTGFPNPVTTALAMPKIGSAVYTGKWIGFTTTATNIGVQLGGNASLTATFTALGGSVTGTLTGLSTQNSNAAAGVLTNGTFNNLTVSAGVITANAFTANIKAGAPGTNVAASLPLNTAGVGTFKGHFYGPTANEVAGTFRLVSGTRQVMGAFGAKK